MARFLRNSFGNGLRRPSAISQSAGSLAITATGKTSGGMADSFGQTYGRWAAEWWQWALGVPGAVNPLTDTTGEHCAQRQVDKVWFLAG